MMIDRLQLYRTPRVQDYAVDASCKLSTDALSMSKRAREEDQDDPFSFLESLEKEVQVDAHTHTHMKHAPPDGFSAPHNTPYST